ncbi:MAG: HAD family hydrolase [Candidatus Micrarchaeales archaeon]|nr:HAD family hydrolase [Candidatus Micrarchaeales archaeon]
MIAGIQLAGKGSYVREPAMQQLRTPLNQNGTKTNLAIVDVDGTLVFVTEAKRRADTEVFGRSLTRPEFEIQPKELKRRSYDLVATKYKDLLVPNKLLVEMLNRKREQGVVVAVLTGRWKHMEEQTRETLQKIGLEFDWLFTNPDGNVKDEEFKMGLLPQLAVGFESIDVYEDKEDNIHFFKRKTDTRFSFHIVRPEGMLRICSGYIPLRVG